MADEEAQQPQSIQQRIASLKLSQVGQSPLAPQPKPNGIAGKTRPPPPPPPKPGVPARPTGYARPASTNNPPLADHGDHVNNAVIGNQPNTFQPDAASANGMDGISRPSLPPRTSTQSSQSSLGPKLPPRTPSATSPALPPRRPSEMILSRKASNDSVSSMATTRSSVSAMSNGTSMTSRSERYAVRAPEFNPAALPPLPPKRTKEELQAHEQKYNTSRPGKSTSGSLSNAFRKTSAPNVPTRPQLQGRPTPPLPARNGVRQEQPTPTHEETQAELPPRRVQAPPPRKSALTMGFGTATAPKQETMPAIESGPPPIPTSSRPDLAALQASKPKIGAAASVPQPIGGAGSCLLCRDFSGPDSHAARFPRQSIPSNDVGWLAHQLTSPFPSVTDKARAIFTWLHHNVAYDVVAFRSNDIRPSTPQSTLTSGMAVCEGYAGLFAALAVKAGLEAVVISGASKGGDYKQQKYDDPVPPFKSDHAWNACRLDDGNWKLIDPCWGAGCVNPGEPYRKRFSPERFTQSNMDFGRSHFPTDNSKQYCEDGGLLSWETFSRQRESLTEATVFNSGKSDIPDYAQEGLAPGSFSPLTSPIVRANQGPTTRFMFQKICPHWDITRHGHGQHWLYTLHTPGLEGTGRDHMPFEQGDGVWWCDVPTADLGIGDVVINRVTQFDGREGRGLSKHEYNQKKGKVGMGWSGVAKWEVV